MDGETIAEEKGNFEKMVFDKRMNYIFHQSLEEKCHRMLNAIEPGTEIPKDDGTMIESVVLSQEDGLYGVDIPKGVCFFLLVLVLGRREEQKIIIISDARRKVVI